MEWSGVAENNSLFRVHHVFKSSFGLMTLIIHKMNATTDKYLICYCMVMSCLFNLLSVVILYLCLSYCYLYIFTIFQKQLLATKYVTAHHCNNKSKSNQICF